MYDSVGKNDIIFMPTVFSLTHTKFAKTQADKGARIASMPGFTMKMLDTVETSKEMSDLTIDAYHNLLNFKFVHVTGKDTDILVEVDNKLADSSLGTIESGNVNNLPGAEAFAVPVHCGKSEGFFTVPKGWGGDEPLQYECTFHVKKGRFSDVTGRDDEAQEWIDEHVKPKIFGEPDFDILAEIGIGTNPNITPEYIEKNGWSTLLAEKIAGSAHFANGNSKGMGGKNDVPTHLDWVVPNVTIKFINE